MIKLGISGIAGRMGKRIGILASKDRGFEIKVALESADSPSIGKDAGEILGLGKINSKIESDFGKVVGDCDVLIDFTFPDVTMEHLEIARKNKIAMVIGTTAISPEQIEVIKSAAEEIPIVFSPNMSVGANLLFKLTGIAANSLDKTYKIEIIEAHHAKKKDAPSGTAKRLGEAVLKVRGETPQIESIREGDIVGDHSVIFSSASERIELKHSAYSRDTFARGALDAASFIAGKRPGLYTMHDVIDYMEKGEL